MRTKRLNQRTKNNVIFALFMVGLLLTCQACLTESPVIFHPDMKAPTMPDIQ